VTIRAIRGKAFEAEIDNSRCIFCAQCVDSCPKKALESTEEFELAQLDRAELRVIYKESPRRGAAPVQDIERLKARLRQVLEGAQRIAVLAVGSRLRGDDAVGLLAGEELERLVGSGGPFGVEVVVFYGETAPENITGEVREFRPTHLVVVDAADMGVEPGTAKLVEQDSHDTGASFSTHRMPALVLLDYLRNATGCRSAIIGIQPASTAFSASVSQQAERAAANVAAAIVAALPCSPREPNATTDAPQAKDSVPWFALSPGDK
jgi:hydrogenase 3 maturation protease